MISVDIRLKELLHNLKDRNWDVNPIYKIDENEARKIIEALEDDGWVLCSERLPEESLNSVIGWDAYRERSDESFDIVAWMPLPTPYKTESEK